MSEQERQAWPSELGMSERGRCDRDTSKIMSDESEAQPKELGMTEKVMHDWESEVQLREPGLTERARYKWATN